MELKRDSILYRLPIYVLIVFSLSNLWGLVLDISPNPFIRFIITAIVAVVIHFICSYPFYWIIALVTSIVPLLIINRYKTDLIYNMITRVQQLIQNTSNYFKGTEEIFSHHLTLFWVIITAVLSCITWIIMVKTKKIWLLLPTYILFFIYYWYIYVDAAYPTMILFLVLYFILLGGAGYLRAEKKWSSGAIEYNNGLYPLWIKTALAYGLVIVILASILPKVNNLVEWYWVEDQITKRFPIVMDLRDDLVYSRSFGQARLFDFTETGFQQDSTELGGPVQLRNEIVMEVKSPISLYLRGNVKTIYENNRWERGGGTQYAYKPNERLQVQVLQGRVVEIEINNINLATFGIFAPYQPVRIITGTSERIFVDEDFQITRQTGTYKNERYKIQAIIPQARSTVEGEEHHLNNPERYLQLPLGLSPQITQLANEITRGKVTPFEKAEAIQNYLRFNFDYSLEPNRTPEGREFVEYFLFEEKQGYCTYFATAMAVMLRTQGIPTRYIEGYRTPEGAPDDLFIVRQNNAHAWVEAYMEPIGWFVFEPTPAYQPPALTREILSGTNGEIQTEFDEMEMLRRLGLESNPNESNDIIIETPIEGDEGLNSPQQEPLFPTERLWDRLFKIIYTTFISLMLLRILINYFMIEGYLKKVRENDSSISIQSLYQNILDLLAEMGHPIQVGETPYEYSKRIIPNIYDNQYNLKQATEVFIRVRYGGQVVSDSETQNLLNYLKVIDKKLRVHLGFWQFHYKKYILGTMYKNYNK